MLDLGGKNSPLSFCLLKDLCNYPNQQVSIAKDKCETSHDIKKQLPKRTTGLYQALQLLVNIVGRYQGNYNN